MCRSRCQSLGVLCSGYKPAAGVHCLRQRRFGRLLHVLVPLQFRFSSSPLRGSPDVSGLRFSKLALSSPLSRLCLLQRVLLA